MMTWMHDLRQPVAEALNYKKTAQPQKEQQQQQRGRWSVKEWLERTWMAVQFQEWKVCDRAIE